jgi:hypothetical protein
MPAHPTGLEPDEFPVVDRDMRGRASLPLWESPFHICSGRATFMQC